MSQHSPIERDSVVVPVDLIVAHGVVVTVDAERRVLTDGALAIRDGELVAVGPAEEILAAYEGRETIDASDCLVMPGLIDAHSHLNQGQRGMVPDDVPSMPWLMQWVLPATVALTPEEENLFARLVCAEHLRTGTTTVAEGGNVRHVGAVVEAVETVGLRANLGCLTWDNPMVWEQINPRLAVAKMTTDEALAGAAEAIDAWHGALDGRIGVWVHLNGGGSASPRLLQESLALARSRGVGVSQHEAHDETYAERVLGQTGKRPVELLADLDVLGPDMRLVHAHALSDAEVALIAETGTQVVTTPTAAWRLAAGMAHTGKVPELLAAGVSVALATDSCNASNSADMVRAMGIAAGVWRDIRRDVGAVGVADAIEMATINGAKSLLMEDRIGSLEAGKRADVVLMDVQRLEWTPMIDPLQNLVLSASGDSVQTVIVDGEVVLRDGRPTRFDEQALIAELRRIDWVERIEAWTGQRRTPTAWRRA
jgi:cytosine/adenosine deaminase-related metal-dependent hydrolase